MASMAIVAGSMGALSLSTAVLPGHAKQASVCALGSVKHLSTSSSFCSSTSTSRKVVLNVPLRIEAREPTRRETVKVRHRRIRRKLSGTTERPRLAVFRSNKHLYAQVIDDTKQHTLAASSTLAKALREELEMSSGPTVDAARRVGLEIAKVCQEKGITKVSFDRGGFVYHGRIQALADAAREGGLEF